MIPTSLHEPDIQLRHTHTHTHTHKHAKIHTRIQMLTHKYTKAHTRQGHCQGCKDFPSDAFPLAWRETLPARQPRPPPPPPPLPPPSLSPPLYPLLQKPHDTQLQVKGERDPKIKTTSHPPTPRILRHPPNAQSPGYLSLLPTSRSPALRNWGID